MNDFRYAIRMLFKARGLSAIAIIALALGIGAATAIFGIVYAFLLRPLPYAQPAELVALQSRQIKSGAELGVGYLDFQDWKKNAKSFADLAYLNRRWNGNLELPDGTTETLKTTFATWNLFHLLGVEPALGRNFLAVDDEPAAPRVALISYRLWQRAFASDPSAIGRDIHLDGETRTVVGVMPKDFRFPTQSDIWIPMGATFASARDRAWRPDQAIGRLRSNASLTQARAEMNLIGEQIAKAFPATNRDVGVAVIPLREQATGEIGSSLVLLFAACGGVLLIACANVSQLLLAKATARRHELAVRAALGASRARLARQLFVESAVLAGCGSAGGILLSFWLVDLMRNLIPVELPFWVAIDVNPIVLAFTVAISFFTALLAGSLPAWHATRLQVAPSLRSNSTHVSANRADSRAREILLVAQIATSIVLLVGSALVVRSMLRLHEVDSGFDARNVLLFEVNPTYRDKEPTKARVERFEKLLRQLAQMPGVDFAAANNSPPFVAQHPWNRSEFTGEGQSEAEQRRNPPANFQTVSADYFRALRIPLLEGRVFDERDGLDAPKVCIVGEKIARRLWPNESALGHKIHLGGLASADEDLLTIIGVVRDVRHQALANESGPDLYKPTGQLAWKQLHFLVRMRAGWAKSPLAFFPTVRRELAATTPDVGVYNAAALEGLIADSFWQARLRSWLLAFFSVVALFLAAAGLYGAVAYGVTQRTREFGVRMTLGATRRAILGLVLQQGLRTVAVGIALGVAGAFLFSRLLRASLFGVRGSDPASYFLAILLLALIAFVACLIPARHASRLNPIDALRSE